MKELNLLTPTAISIFTLLFLAKFNIKQVPVLVKAHTIQALRRQKPVR